MAPPITKRIARAELSRIAGNSAKPDAFRQVEALIDRIFDPRTPTNKIELEASRKIFRFSPDSTEMPVQQDDKEAYGVLQNAIITLLKDRGYRPKGDICTYQEHRLVGSTGQVDEFERTPYTPLGILTGEVTLQEVIRARALMIHTQAMDAMYGLEVEEIFVPVTLEPLNERGETKRDPRVLDSARLEAAIRVGTADAIESCIIQAEKIPDFPYKRD